MQSNTQPSIQLEDIVKKIPFTCRLIFVAGLVTWLLDFISITTGALMNSNLSWQPKFKVWQIVTASFCVNSLFSLMIVAINMYTFMPKLQTKVSSSWLIINFIVTGIAIQLIYTIIGQLLPASFTLYVYFGSIEGIWFNLMFKYCYFNRDYRIKLCCFPIKISKLAYPFIFLAVFMLLDFKIKLDGLIGIGLATMECILFKGSLISCTSEFVNNFMSRFQCWVLVDQVPQRPFEGLQDMVVNPRLSGISSTDDSNVDYFKNKKGVRLG